MLTKSLHTITAATNVARHLLHFHPSAYTTPTAAWQLAHDALHVLGYMVPVASAEGTDDTVRRIRENCAKLLAEVRS